MMNDIAIDNITRILNNEIGTGNNVIGVISVTSEGHIQLCWRTDDTKRRDYWEAALRAGVKGDSVQEMVPIQKEV